MPIVFAIVTYLCLWPVPIHAVSWHPEPAPGYVGPYATNTKLTSPHQIDLHGEIGPEHVLVGPDDAIFVGVESGRILRLSPDGMTQQIFANTDGRPLGMAFDAAGNLIVADARKGLLSISPSGKQTVLMATSNGGPLFFPNAVAIGTNGIIYVTDSSQRFKAEHRRTTQEAALLDIMEQSATGRVIAYDPVARTNHVVAVGLSFANGIVLTKDEHSLLVSESGRYRVWKIPADARDIDIGRSPIAAVALLENLPGYPDNLTRGRDGRVWLALAGPRNDIDRISNHPFIREMALRLPRALLPTPIRYGHVIAFTEDGAIVNDLQDPSSHAPTITGLTETAQRYYLHNVDDGRLSVLDVTDHR